MMSIQTVLGNISCKIKVFYIPCQKHTYLHSLKLTPTFYLWTIFDNYCAQSVIIMALLVSLLMAFLLCIPIAACRGHSWTIQKSSQQSTLHTHNTCSEAAFLHDMSTLTLGGPLVFPSGHFITQSYFFLLWIVHVFVVLSIWYILNRGCPEVCFQIIQWWRLVSFPSNEIKLSHYSLRLR